MLAVQWPEVDFAAGGIHVRKQITVDEQGQTVEAELKTEQSEAFVPMPQWYMDQLSGYRE